MAKVEFDWRGKVEKLKLADLSRHEWFAVDRPGTKRLDVIIIDGCATYRLQGTKSRTFRPLMNNTFIAVYTTRRELLEATNPGKRKKRFWLKYRNTIEIVQVAPNGTVYSQDGGNVLGNTRRFEDDLFASRSAALRQAIKRTEKEAKREAASLSTTRKRIRALKAELAKENK